MLKQLKMSGFTLVEIMIALLINALLFAAVITIFTAVMKHYREFKLINQLDTQLQTVVSLMANDIRRAGYWSGASGDIGLGQNNNPFMASGTDITASGNCILFTYDRNQNGTLPSISSSIDDERYGYRLSNMTILTRPPGAGFSCSATDWENFTDPNVIQVTSLTFTLASSQYTTGPGSQAMTFRRVTIDITGRLTSNPSITQTISRQVKVQNDKFSP